jgi:sulfate/thiosulfate transport system substrate-binding protein
MAKWIAVFAFCGVTVFAQSTLSDASRDVGQEAISQNGFRPTSETVARKQANKFKSIRLVRIDDVSGGWARAQKTHFADGGTVDQTYGK